MMSELKERALIERISQIVAEYENQAAEYRVALTELSQERDSLREQLNAKDEPLETTVVP
jgi:uncharacterized coiled-coil DUF342 family protein